MKKVALLAIICVMFVGMVAEAQVKKIAVSGRISWCPGDNNPNQGAFDDRDFDVMWQYSIDDENTADFLYDNGYNPILMPDYVLQSLLAGGCPFPPGDDADYTPYINEGDYMKQTDFLQADNFDCAYNTGTCWSSIGAPMKDAPIPVIQGEHSNLGINLGKPGSMQMFTGSTGDHNGLDDTIVLTAAGQAHEMTADLGPEIVVFGDGPAANPTQTWQGIWADAASAAAGVTVLGTWKSDPTRAALAIMEPGGLYADGNPAPARRVMAFWGGGEVRPMNGNDMPSDWLSVFDHMTPAGKELHLRMFQWAMGDLTPKGSSVANWELSK